MTPAETRTPDLIVEAARRLRQLGGTDAAALADELDIRGDRLTQLEYQAAPDRNDLTGQTPAQIMALVNAPSPAGA